MIFLQFIERTLLMLRPMFMALLIDILAFFVIALSYSRKLQVVSGAVAGGGDYLLRSGTVILLLTAVFGIALYVQAKL
jgi:hypothetical protein